MTEPEPTTPTIAEMIAAIEYEIGIYGACGDEGIPGQIDRLRATASVLSSLSPLIEAARRAYDPDGPSHARYNLDGAIIDIEYNNGHADEVCMRTLRRVSDQLFEIESVLSTFPAKPSSAEGRDGWLTQTFDCRKLTSDALRVTVNEEAGTLSTTFPAPFTSDRVE